MVPSFIDFLQVRLASELPGRQAQLRMAPRVPRLPEPPPEVAASCRKSAVLILLAEGRDDYDVLLTVRNSGMAHHGGQISFPGGRIEPGEDVWSAAVRETEEEVGIGVGPEMRSVGMLSTLYVPVSNNIIYPVVAYAPEAPEPVANPAEVEEAFYTPLSLLASGTALQEEEWTLHGGRVLVPHWVIHRVPLWGATAMILSELLAVYEDYSAAFG